MDNLLDIVCDIGPQLFNGEEEVGAQKISGHYPEGDGS